MTSPPNLVLVAMLVAPPGPYRAVRAGHHMMSRWVLLPKATSASAVALYAVVKVPAVLTVPVSYVDTFISVTYGTLKRPG